MLLGSLERAQKRGPPEAHVAVGPPSLAVAAARRMRGAAATLLLAVAATLAGGPATAAAQRPAYEPELALARALARYQALAAGPDLRPPLPRTTLRAGAVLHAADTLRRFLVTLGDLPPSSETGIAAEADTIYDDELAAGVVRFQRRHGLEPDGVIGPATRAQMAVPLERRVRQLELAVERWRALPDTVPERMIVVNVPAFQLHALERDSATGRPVLHMKVIVGEARGGHDTPLFSGLMREVVFQPYWDVPPSIAVEEVLPKARRDIRYLEREHMEIVRGGDHDAVIHPSTRANLARVASGALRLRQRPGPWNALGAVKFVFPNPYNVYLHGTPAQQLFDERRRDFSHGCIRVEDPTALARWVFEREPGWDSAAVVAGMTTGAQSRRVRLARPVPVHVLYVTASVADGGIVQFHPDIYGHDAAALAASQLGAARRDRRPSSCSVEVS